MSSKGQWFVVSAVIASATFVTISILYSGYFSLDSSKVFAQDEGPFFDSIIYGLNRTMGYSGSDSQFAENLKDFKFYAEQKALERGYFLKIINDSSLRISGTNFSIYFSSSNINISKSFGIPLQFATLP